MKLSELKKILSENLTKSVHFTLPTGTKIPLHAHVTDVARIDKKFIDCGGTFRTETFCRLQVWFADDTEHRVGANMLNKVLQKSAPFLETEDMEVDVEYEAPFISQFPVSSIEVEGDVVVLHLGIKHTACLALDKCLPPTSQTASHSFKPIPTFSNAGKCC